MRDDAAYVVLDNGTWIPVANGGSVSQDINDQGVESTSVTGARRYLVPSAPVRSRTWSVSCKNLPASWADVVGVLENLSLSKTAFAWVPPLARSGNGLESEWTSTAGVGVVAGQPGVLPAASGVVSSGLARVRPGKTYTFSVFADPSFTGSLKATVQNAAGDTLELGTLSGVGGNRRAYTGVIPAWASLAGIQVTDAGGKVIAPAVSESPAVRPYTAPRGCSRAVLTMGSFDHETALNRMYKVSYDFKVMEVA